MKFKKLGAELKEMRRTMKVDEKYLSVNNLSGKAGMGNRTLKKR